MAEVRITFSPAIRGYASEFAESEQPPEYAHSLENRYIDLFGKLAKRRGMQQLGKDVSGAPTLSGVHEWVDTLGNATLFVSASGVVYRYNTTTQAYDVVYTATSTNRLYSVQFSGKLIFVNGVDRNFYTDDGGNSFHELQPIIEQGTYGSGSSGSKLVDGQILNWVSETNVAENDLVYNVSQGAYAVVTSVGASALDTTPIGPTAIGLGFTSAAATAGDIYSIYDLIATNVISTPNGPDNIAQGSTGTNTSKIAVSGTNFGNTEIRKGDYIYNTTRVGITQVASVGTDLDISPAVSSQVAGDSFVFLKKAMPIASYAHVHYDRAYFIDARDLTKVRISGLDDPQDMTTFQKTIQSGTLNYGGKQPNAERLFALKTFQSYLVALGERNVFSDSGTDPIRDTSAASFNFTPVGVFNQGGISPLALESIGNLMCFASNDGLRGFGATFNIQTLQTQNLSEVLKSELIEKIATYLTSSLSDREQIQLTHYPRRNWLLYKIGDTIYNFNYTGFYSQGQIQDVGGSWSLFTGKFAEQNIYFVRRDGTLIGAGADGKVYEMDVGYNDDGDTIATDYRSAWLKITQEPVLIQELRHIKPIFDSTNGVVYTITGTGDFKVRSRDSISVTAAGASLTTQGFQVGQSVIGQDQIGASTQAVNSISYDKYPLRCRGEQFNIRMQTESASGPDIITSFTLYGNLHGVK